MKKTINVLLCTIFTFYVVGGVVVNTHYYIAHCDCVICNAVDAYINFILKCTELYVKGVGIVLFCIPFIGLFAVSLVRKQQ